MQAVGEKGLLYPSPPRICSSARCHIGGSRAPHASQSALFAARLTHLPTFVSGFSVIPETWPALWLRSASGWRLHGGVGILVAAHSFGMKSSAPLGSEAPCVPVMSG